MTKEDCPKEVKKSKFPYDSQEDDPVLGPLIEAASKEAYRECSELWRGQVFPTGSCHVIWEKQTEICKAKYGIDWKSPAKINPNIFFD
jgi:hypothetical protein